MHGALRRLVSSIFLLHMLTYAPSSFRFKRRLYAALLPTKIRGHLFAQALAFICLVLTGSDALVQERTKQ